MTKRIFFCALLAITAFSASGQKKLQVSERDISGVIFREAGDNETVVEVQSNVPLSFESTMDKQVNVYEMYPESGFFIYRLKFSTGNTYRGRQLIIKSYGFMNYDYPLELQAKKPVGLLVLNPDVKVGADIITLKNGDHIQSIVQEVGKIDVKYKKIDNPNGPNYVLEKSEIFMITYANGSKDVFNNNTAPVTSTTPATAANNSGVTTTEKSAPVTNVPASVFVKSIAITPTGNVSVAAGKTTTLTATITPSNATNKKVVWSSLNTDIATVSASTGIVLGIRGGTVTIRATADDGSGVTIDKDVTVHVPVTSISINPAGNESIEVGTTTTLSVTVDPSNATQTSVTWSSLNTNIAMVSAQTGVVIGISAGTTTIRATATDGSGITANKSITVYKILPIEFEMVFMQGGTFLMGGTREQGDDVLENEKPVHQVTVNDFYIGKYEVTQKQWQAIMGSNPSTIKGDNLPVVNVSWNDVHDFITRLNKTTGKQYRLPTEAEWEFAARGGNKSNGYKYSGSNNFSDVSLFDNNGKVSKVSVYPVGTKLPNELGIYDMSGNALEWCQDWYGAFSNENQINPIINPIGPSTGNVRVARGGQKQFARVSYRCGFRPNSTDNGLGFRIVLSQ